MNKFKCRHDWEIAEGYRQSRLTENSSILHCKKCGVALTASEAAQIELWKHTVGIQKWLSIGAFMISVIALIVSLNQ